MALPVCSIFMTLSVLLMFGLSPRGDRTRRVLALERIEGRAHHIVGVGRAERFRHHVLHAQRLEHGAHRAAGDDARPGWRRPQEYAARCAPCSRRWACRTW